MKRQYVDTGHDDETVHGSFQKTLGEKDGPIFVRQKRMGPALVQGSQRKSSTVPCFWNTQQHPCSPAPDNVSGRGQNGTLFAKINSGKKPGFD
ncbi:MAG: hypothetical protein JRI80_03390 [Deltaproteobacteria bacterium]|nr:hypothetical protein [Deltaproteobacteria bacterium]